MDNQTAIAIIKNCTTLACEYHIKDKCDKDYSQREDDFEKAKKIAIEAIEKQIPKEPTREPWELPRCPSCGAALGEWIGDGYTKDWENKKICDCGQKIKWGED